MTCSNINENKRIYRMPEIIAQINKKAKWIHFGKGNPADVEKLELEIKKYNLGNYCFLNGFKPNYEVLDFYKNNQVDFIFNLSQVEGIPVSLMEAASFGIPMIATKTVGNPEIVNSKNGFLIEVIFDSKELVLQLNRYFENKEEMISKRNAAKEMFFENYNADVNYPLFCKNISAV